MEVESKRDFLYRLFPRLEEAGDAGLRLVNRMADSLVEQSSFPDLAGWEDSGQKIKDASESVAALRSYRNEQQSRAATAREIADAKKRAEAITAEIRARQDDLAKLDVELTEVAKRLGTAEAGYAFQGWFYKVADFFEIVSRRPYVIDGRQIDGSITVAGTTYLVELKFTTLQSEASDIDTFFKKVNGKADNTMGVMFSISGYSSVAIKEASGPKCLLLLFDHNHLYMLLRGTCTFEDLINRVRRHASQTGEAYLSPARFE
jgi:hypothetical protein